MAFCWTHVRRDFLDAAKKYTELEGWSLSWVEKIGELYHINNKRRKNFDIKLSIQGQSASFDEQHEKLVEKIEKHIKDGDLAVIVPANDAHGGAIVAVLVDRILPEATLKIIRRRKNTVELHAANPEYPPLIFRGKDRKRVRILGEYVGLIRRE